MRKATAAEQSAIEAIANALPRNQRDGIIADLAHSSLTDEVGDGSRLVFVIDGYQRPKYRGQHAFPVEGRMQDRDGADLHVVLYADENGRLLELELIRWMPGSVLGPNWSTFRLDTATPLP